jgi:microcystin-dependent protein
MAWVNPVEVAAGDPLTETLWNQDVVENGRFYLPTGALVPYVGATAPDAQFLLCNGAAVSRSTYADLFAVCSTTYGAGDGSTTFNVPDLRGRMPMGAGTGAGLNATGTGAPTGTAQTARTLGQWFGEETHLLTGAESGTSVHGHGFTARASSAGGSFVVPFGGTFQAAVDVTINNGGVSNSSAANASQRHATIPPVIVTNYLIKT